MVWIIYLSRFSFSWLLWWFRWWWKVSTSTDVTSLLDEETVESRRVAWESLQWFADAADSESVNSCFINVFCEFLGENTADHTFAFSHSCHNKVVDASVIKNCELVAGKSHCDHWIACINVIAFHRDWPSFSCVVDIGPIKEFIRVDHEIADSFRLNFVSSCSLGCQSDCFNRLLIIPSKNNRTTEAISSQNSNSVITIRKRNKMDITGVSN